MLHPDNCINSASANPAQMYLSNSLLQFTLDGTAPASVQEGARDLDACNWDLESVPSDAVMIIP